MFTVTGTLTDGTDYTLTWDDGDISGDGAAYAEVVGLLGQSVGLTPTGPFVTVDEADPQSVLAALAQVGTITDVTGNPPPTRTFPTPEGAQA